MTIQDNKHDLKFWDKAVRLYQSTDISLPKFCERNGLDQAQFEQWVKLFCYTSKDTEEKRQFKESYWKFQAVKLKYNQWSPTGLAFTGRETICEVVLKNGRHFFFDSTISEASLHKIVSVLELKK